MGVTGTIRDMRALIVINERAGSLSARVVEKSIHEELQHFPQRIRSQVTVLVTGSIAEVRDYVDHHYQELDRVIAAGGDGTVIEVISAILPYSHLMLGIIPVGTGNRLASNLGIPNHIKGALETALTGEPHHIDIGRINQRYFALMAGVGLDAEIMDQVHPIEKRTMGVLAYFWKGVQRAFRTPYAVFDIEVDGTHVRSRGIGVVIANAGNLLGRFFTLTPGAKPDDGLLDICILASRRRTDYWSTVVQILSQQSWDSEETGVKHMRGKRIIIRSRPRVKAQADGDVIGTTPIEVEAIPSAIAVLVPPAHKTGNPITQSIHHITDHVRLVIRDLFHYTL